MALGDPTTNPDDSTALPASTPDVWYGDAPELKSLVDAKGWKSPADALTSYANLERSLGGRLAVPKDDAPVAEWDAFYGKLGRPEKPDGYGEYAPPDGFVWDRDAEKRFYAAAHAAGLNNRAVKSLLDWHVSEMTALASRTRAEAASRREAATGELRKAWGANYDRNVAVAQSAVAKAGGDELAQLLESGGLGDHPAFLRFALALGEQLLEDGDLPAPRGGLTTDEIKAEIARLQADKAFTDREHPEHKRTIERLTALFQAAFPG